MIESKICTMCKEILPFKLFSKHGKSKDGLQSSCRICNSKRLKLWYDSMSKEDREERRKRHNLNCASSRAKDPETYYWARLKSTYGLTKERYDVIFESQGRSCGICDRTEPTGRYGFVIDHDHDCCPGNKSCGDCVRGILCSMCNHGLGNFEDDPQRILSAADYLSGKVAIKKDD